MRQPRYFVLFTDFRVWPCILYSNWMGGSVLEPSLFLFYINDTPCGLKSTVRLFADDTIAYLAVTSEADAVDLQSNLNKHGYRMLFLSAWFIIWLVIYLFH
jgi:hypothetical protein